jgi:hypothetical protein
VNAVYALYRDPDDVQRAVDNLRAAGIQEEAITVISSEPIEEYEFSHRHAATWLYWIAGAGGVLGLLVATWLARFTEIAWPLPTGNMPIVAWWPNLVIIFEMTMLGAIVTTVISLLVASKLPKFGKTLYDPAVSDGKILVGVPLTGPDEAIRDTFTRAGAAAVKTIDL